MMTIIVHFHRTSYRTFKAYYTRHVMERLSGHFPGWVSYTRFAELIKADDPAGLGAADALPVQPSMAASRWGPWPKISSGSFLAIGLHCAVAAREALGVGCGADHVYPLEQKKPRHAGIAGLFFCSATMGRMRRRSALVRAPDR